MNYYVALIHKDRRSDFGVMFPDFPGCISAGATYEEAVQMGAEALAFHVDGLQADGSAVPEPRSVEQIRGAKEDWIDWKDAVIAMIPLLPSQGKPKATNVSLDSALLTAIDHYADSTGLTRSGVLSEGARLLMLTRPVSRKTKQVRGKPPRRSQRNRAGLST
jgi:predicted RNase H-like HicB family nuclease